MSLTSWLAGLNKVSSKPRHRRGSSGQAVAAIVEMLEVRKLLSAAPAIANLGPNLTYTEGAPPTMLSGNATVSDASKGFANSTLTIATTNGSMGDQLGVLNGNGVGMGPKGAVMFAASASATPAQVGTVTGGSGNAPLTISFNENATQLSVQAVLDQVGYGNGTSTLAIPDRTIAFQFTDGSGAVATAVTKSIHVNPATVISNIAPTLNYTEGAPPAPVFGQAQISDAANAYANSNLSVGISNGSSGDQLGILTGNGVGLGPNGAVLFAASATASPTIIGTVSGGTGSTPLVVQFNAKATQAGVQAVMDQVVYGNGTSTLATPNRQVNIVFTDDNGLLTVPIVQGIHVNAAPVIGNIAPPLNYTEGAPPVPVLGKAELSDAANAYSNSSVSIGISNGLKGDQLGVLAGNGVGLGIKGAVLFAASASDSPVLIGTVSGGTGSTPLVIQFNASATQAGVQAVMDQVVYGNGTSTLATPDRQITIVFSDGNKVSTVPMHQAIHVIPAPVISDAATSPAITKINANPVVLEPVAMISDAAGAYANSKLSVQLSGGDSSDQLGIQANGSLTIGANNSLLFNGSVVGTFAGGNGSTALTISFNAKATHDSVQAVLDNVTFTYVTTSNTPDLNNRVATFAFTDGNNVASALIKQDIQVTT